MCLGKLSLKVAALALVGAVSSMAASSSLAPLTFGDSKTDADNWNYLINYKLWGQSGISFGNQPLFKKPSGWIGTSDGDLTQPGNEGELAGAIIVGGSIEPQEKTLLTTGPFRYKTSLVSGHATGTKCKGTTTSGDCAKVPQYRENLKVPTLSGVTYEEGFSIGDRDVATITVPQNGSYDVFIDHIKFGSSSVLLVNMPAGGHTTRVFVKNLELSDHPHILVQYENETLPRCNSSHYTCGGSYEGNLLIYSENSFTFDNTDNSPVVGTFMSAGTIKIGRNMDFAGQMLAKVLDIGNQIIGENFEFVPFKEYPKLVLSNTTATFPENDEWKTVNVTLSDVGDEDVTFEYCFEFNSSAVTGKFAGKDDVKLGDSKHDFPICDGTAASRKTAKIKAGSTSLETGIYINAKVDGLVEGADEKLWLNIYNLEGAEPSADNFEAKENNDGLKGGFNIFIQDMDELPTGNSNLTVKAYEDYPYTFASSNFNYNHPTRSFASVIITSLPKGTLALLDDNGTITLGNNKKATPIKTDVPIAVANLGKLVYQAAANDFGNDYTTFKYSVRGSGSGDNTSEVYTAKINVVPVNDKPKGSDATFTVNELDHAVAGGPIKIEDVSNERNKDTYTYKLVNVSGSDYTAFNNLFEIVKNSDQTATIKVKADAVLNYKEKNQYVVYATVTDNAATEWSTETVPSSVGGGAKTSDRFKITVKLNNENDNPEIAAQTFTIPEKDTDGSDWPAGTLVPNGLVKANDPDGDPMSFEIATTGIPFDFKKGTNQLIVKDGSQLDYEAKSSWTFKVKVSDDQGGSATANITVKLEDVNEPSEIKIDPSYSVNENSKKGFEVGTFVVSDFDKISNKYETLTYKLSGALTGAAAASKELKGKTLNDIFELVQTSNNDGIRTVAIRVKNQELLNYEYLYNKNSHDATYQATITIQDEKSPTPNIVTVKTKIAVLDVNENPWINDGTFYILEHSDAGTQVCVSYDDNQICTKYAPVDAGDVDVYNSNFGISKYEIKGSTDFEISSGGRISVVSDFAYNKLYPKNNTKTFTVVVTDKKGLTAEATITVKILDVEEVVPPSYVDGTKFIKENSEDHISFKKESLSAEDQAKFDALGDDPVYELTSVSDARFDNLFDVIEGVIYPKTDDALNYEALVLNPNGTAATRGNEFDITITAKGNGESLPITFHVAITDVNEESVFTEYGPYSVDETLESLGHVGTIVATDPDNCSTTKPCAKHPNGFNNLHYFVNEVYAVNGSKAFPFDLDETSGEITLKKGERLRFAEQNQYKFKVMVRDASTDADNPPIAVYKDVIINVVDINEPSEFRVLSDLYEVEENKPADTELTGDEKIVVYDEDVGDIDKLKISITNNDPASSIDLSKLFVVVQEGKTTNHLSTFVIKTKKKLNYEELYEGSNKGVFDVTLSVTDSDGNKTDKTTKLRVIDVNEEPSFKKDSYEFTVDENIVNETELGKAEASDPDVYNTNFGTLYYSLKGEEAALFDIDRRTGMITTVNNAKFNYEKKPVYQFTVVVTDNEFTETADVTVTVNNVDEPPVLQDPPPPMYVDENSKVNTLVGVITATDDDCSNNHKCEKPTFDLVATDLDPDDYKAFKIDNEGNIKVKDDVLNYEVQNEYHVRVVATDGKNTSLSTYVDLTIFINDVNDAPTYELKEYVFEIHETAPKGEFVGSVVADDEDSWSVLGYELSDYIANSGDASIFEIDEDGNIFLSKKALNYEDKSKYQVWAKATDNGKAYGKKIGRTDFVDYEAKTLVTIKIIDDPDKPIVHDDGEPSYDVKENTAEEPIKNTEIACYEVTDEDDGQVATLVPYVTDAGNTDADRLFDAKIKKSGSKYELCLIVKNASKLNYESIPHVHKIFVGVMDEAGLVSEVAKTINIIDVNEMPIISGSLVFSLYENDTKSVSKGFGKLNSADIDTAKVYTDNVYKAIGGDLDLFDIEPNGTLKAKRVFDFEKEKVLTYKLEVSLSDRDSKKYPTLTTKTTITIQIKDSPEKPEITTKEFEVEENSEEGVLIGIIEAIDPDGEGELLFSLAEKSPYVTVSEKGEIHVAKDAVIDYETTQQFTIKVTVKDADGLKSTSDIVIKVIDVNEAPKIEPQEFIFPEDSKPGTKKGPVEAKDPDTMNKEFSDLKFYPVEENEKFEIKPNGDIILKGDLDYEKEKSYVVKVYVTDGEFTDTTDITIKVGNVIEKSVVEITRVEAGNSVYLKPKKEDPIYTNKEVIQVEWKQDGKTMSSLDTLKEGCQYIVKKYKAPNKDVEGADTIEVCYSTAAPKVDIDATKTKVTADNIYTVVENVDKKDSSIYVNDKTKDVQVSVEDSASGKDTTFNVVVVLDTIAITDKTVKNMVDISKSEISLEKNPKSDVYEMPIGDKTKISYDKVVNGDTVTVSYYVDNKGEVVKTAVFDEDGKKTMTEVIEVSTVVEVRGKKVTVSYKADAETGKILYGDSEGNLMVEVPKSSSSKSDSKDKDEIDLKTGVGAFTVTYDVKGEEDNKTTVSYVVDEKGKIVANEEGDRGYLVTYTYTNIYGNSADNSVFMVLDKLAPIVKILSPSDGDVVFANYVDVEWCIAIDGDEDNCVKQDTLSFQSLEKGVNTIKRIYRDKAGNETIAEINVMMKKAKDVNISLEKPMVIVSIDSVNKYYANNPPDENQTYAVSILNPTTQKEKEVVRGNPDEAKEGSGEEPYQGYDGHIGPTVTIDMKVPIVSAVGGLATLDDIVIHDNLIPLDGVDADGSETADVNEYVKKYCSADFREDFSKNKSDLSKLMLYNTNARVTLWFYTTGGQFVDKYQFNYAVDDPEFVDKAGLVKFFFEMKPDINGELKDKSGRLYGTGPYIVKTKVDIRSQQRCVVPPIKETSKVGDVLKSSDEMLKRFGYRRPVHRGNEKASSSSKKESKKNTKKNSKK